MSWWVEGWPLGWLAKYHLHSALHHWLYWWGYAFTIARSPNAAPVFYCFLCYFLYIIPILLHKIAAETWNAFNYTYNYLGDPLSSDSSVKKIHAAHFTEQICFVYGVYGTNCAIKAVWETLSSHLGSPALWPVLLPAPGLLITSPWPGSFTPPK